MTDIVERLRGNGQRAYFGDGAIMYDAANEIERLRAALKEAAAKRTDCEKSSNELFLRREEAQSELNAAADEIERLRAQNAALREALTPSAETKAEYNGEFKFGITITVFDEDAGEEGEFKEMSREILVPWTTVKEIMKAISARAALATGGDE